MVQAQRINGVSNQSNLYGRFLDKRVLMAILNQLFELTHKVLVPNETNVKRIKENRQKVETELSNICSDIMVMIDEHLIPSASTAESSVFYYKMKGEHYRYLAEFKAADEEEVADLSMKAYDTATSAAEAELPPTHPIRLGLALNFSVFYYEILNSAERACHLAKQAFDEAMSELDVILCDESYKDSTSIMQFLRDNLTLWTFDITEEGEDSPKMNVTARASIMEEGE